MILIAGGTGTLGQFIVPLLTKRGLPVRILTRFPGRARYSGDNSLVEIVQGDVRNPEDIERSMAGVTIVISAISGLGLRGVSPHTVDWEGNRNLIMAARDTKVEHFILVSILGARPDHPMELYRKKYMAEQELKASGVPWSIIRPTVYMETWGRLIWEPLIKTGKARVFGRGNNLVNFVSAYDVAEFIGHCVTDASMRGKVVEVGGPENLTMNQFVEAFELATSRTGAVSHVPLTMMKLMANLVRPVNPTLSRLMRAAIIMDASDKSFNSADTQRSYPSIHLTTLAEMLKRDYSNEAVVAA